jgi:tetratricopeptide (TPR) repeat protein
VKYKTLTRLLLLGSALTLGALGWSQRGAVQEVLARNQDSQAVYAQIQTHTRRLQDSPQDASLWYNRGVLRAQAGDNKAAAADLKRALELEPHDTDGLYNLAWVELRQGQNKVALKHLTQLLQIEPHHLDARWNRAWLQQRLKNQAAALHDYRFIEKYLQKQLKPLEKAELAALLQKPAVAAAAYALALKKEPGQPDALLGRARSLLALKQVSEAEPVLAKAFQQRLNPTQKADLLTLRAELALLQKKPQLALADYLSLRQYEPQNARLELQIASLMAQLGQESQAQEHLTRALKMAPDLQKDPLLQGREFFRLRRLPEVQALLGGSKTSPTSKP